MSDPAHALRRVLIPHEHGAWAFLAEPLLLSHLVAFSPAAPLVAVATTAAFLARRPLVMLVSDGRRGARYPRTVSAEWAVTALLVTAVVALVAALRIARGPMLLAVALAIPLGVVALTLELGRRARELATELTATTALGASAAAIALAAGWTPAQALGLWGVLSARSASTVAYLRARVRLDRGAPAPVGLALLAQAAALLVVIGLVRFGLAPWLAIAAMALLSLRAVHGLSPARWRMTTARLGVTEIVFGLLTVAAVAIGIRLRG